MSARMATCLTVCIGNKVTAWALMLACTGYGSVTRSSWFHRISYQIFK